MCNTMIFSPVFTDIVVDGDCKNRLGVRSGRSLLIPPFPKVTKSSTEGNISVPRDLTIKLMKTSSLTDVGEEISSVLKEKERWFFHEMAVCTHVLRDTDVRKSSRLTGTMVVSVDQNPISITTVPKSFCLYQN